MVHGAAIFTPDTRQGCSGREGEATQTDVMFSVVGLSGINCLERSGAIGPWSSRTKVACLGVGKGRDARCAVGSTQGEASSVEQQVFQGAEVYWTLL